MELNHAVKVNLMSCFVSCRVMSCHMQDDFAQPDHVWIKVCFLDSVDVYVFAFIVRALEFLH